MTNIEQYLLNAKEIAKLALENKSDVEISKELGLPIQKVTNMRVGMGLYHTWKRDIFNGDDTKSLMWYDENATPSVQFGIPKHRIEDLGLNPKVKYVISAKIISKGKIELTIKPSLK